MTALIKNCLSRAATQTTGYHDVLVGRRAGGTGFRSDSEEYDSCKSGSEDYDSCKSGSEEYDSCKSGSEEYDSCESDTLSSAQPITSELSPVLDESGQLHWVNLTGIHFPAKRWDATTGVKFYLYTQNNPSTASVITVNDASSLGNFDSSHETKIVVHGWRSNALSLDEIRSAYISSGEAVNVIMMDWSTGASNLVYEVCRENVVPAGEYLATLINFLASQGMNTASVHIMGHSLGAHIAGVAGNRQTSGTVGKVTGMDPAAPGYINVPAENHLNSDDASFVEVIHTCAGLLGWVDPLGHADFYPNGGTLSQPGCGADVAGTCSHSRSHNYFAESITTTVGFQSELCANWSTYQSGACAGNARALMGDKTPTG
uniref:Lipase domain-containing protein n=1 Tax=Timema cristinae TaxID=61476 RepID=A0A7R9H9E9_TIMCR|nr:unnamed protein product [Timema cristinae]